MRAQRACAARGGVLRRLVFTHHLGAGLQSPASDPRRFKRAGLASGIPSRVSPESRWSEWEVGAEASLPPHRGVLKTRRNPFITAALPACWWRGAPMSPTEVGAVSSRSLPTTSRGSPPRPSPDRGVPLGSVSQARIRLARTEQRSLRDTRALGNRCLCVQGTGRRVPLQGKT